MTGRFERSYRFTVVDAIGGDASQIQTDVITRRRLGFPLDFRIRAVAGGFLGVRYLLYAASRI
ncbi:MAG: hypothetical protein JRG90_08695 [Deltaproteobacteria bacterium]|nr:hypothetical protein [Deltaproteobacteria bacterium]MBW2666832.1 hypothetical protein [Deltaproteobacteria bacterium]